MTKEEIIEMAREAGGIDVTNTRINNITVWLGTGTFEFLEAFAKLAAVKEREECAVICETYWNRPNNGMSTEEEVYGSVTAELIRARGHKGVAE